MRFLLYLGGAVVVFLVGFVIIGIIAALPWWGFMGGLIAIGIVALWIGTLFDVWRRADISTASALIWTAAVIIFPLAGSTVYFFTRPPASEILYRGETVA